MKTYINQFQLRHLISNIILDWETFGPKKVEGKLSYEKIEKISDLEISGKKTIIPFKRVLFPNYVDTKLEKKRKIAFLGLNNCDAWALFRFLEEFEHTDLLPARENILIFTFECKPDRYCFCEKMGKDKFAPFDIYLQEEGEKFSIFSKSNLGSYLISKIGIKNNKKIPQLRPIREKSEEFDQEKITRVINNREKNEDFWEGIAKNCFGCGACSAVCPLCFCTRLEAFSNIDGESEQCLAWDTCFAKKFSEIQNDFDLRPENVDRLYNWYHHKFVRSSKTGSFLCTGCGRCIEACPANLNVKNIISALVEKDKA